MEQESINPQSLPMVRASGIPLSLLALRQKPLEAEQSSEDASRLKRIAEEEARSWNTSQENTSYKLLRSRWTEASDSITAVLYSSSKIARQADLPNPAVDELLSNARLLEAAIGDTRELPDTVQQLPEVKTGNNDVIPRAYAAVAAYLRASGWKFQEETFVSFFSHLQEIQPLRIRELWLLNALMQLLLLEEIGHACRRFLDRQGRFEDAASDAERPQAVEGGTISPAEEAPSLESGSLRGVQVSTFVTCLCALEGAAWKGILEQIGTVDHILRRDPCGAYPRMDFESRNLYLQVIQKLGASSKAEEPEIARRAIALAAQAQRELISISHVHERRSHVGFYLIGEGRALLERQIHFRPSFSERVERAVLAWPEAYYFIGIEVFSFAIIAFLLIGARSSVSLIAGLIFLSIPATEAAWGVMNQLTAFILPPRVLAKLDFSEGIPPECATLVVIPTLVLSEAYVRRMVRELEIRYLANRDSHLYFALLTDAPDSQFPSDQSDELVSLCSVLIEELNRKYAGEGGSAFFLFHRFRSYNPSEGSWMGWERKRGKLLDLNDLLRDEKDNFPVKVGDLSVLPKIKYVITLDSDTQLPRGAARRLVATLAHPLNHAVISPRTNTVVEGYGMLQPRVGISVQSASRSLLATIYSGQTGLDLYTHAISDVYQDLFGEGNFAGKGIYEVDVFRKVLGQRFPRNAILSHDLIEGTYTRAGLVSDVEVIDDYPTHFSAYSRRKHRWVRGDWQIMLWLLPRVPDASGKKRPNPLSLLSRWKIFDNLRRSLVEIATFLLLLAGWLSLPGSPVRWTFVALVLLLIPVYLQLLLSLLRLKPGLNLTANLKKVVEGFIAGQINVFFALAFLSHQTLVMLDAIFRTIVRVTITRKRLLEWETAAQAEFEERKTPVDVYLAWTPVLSLVIGGAVALLRPAALPIAAPFLVLWACAGPLAFWLSRPLGAGITKATPKEEEFLRSACLRTWRFFRQSVKEAPCGLAPDNIQETPPRVAQRTSPTNLGLLLNSHLAAYQLGYLTLPEFIYESEKILETMSSLHRFRGHFLNWYDTETLQPLDPWFVSTVDSGNLVCSLWTLKQGCLKAIEDPLLRDATWQGLYDHVSLLDELASGSASNSSSARSLRRIYAHLELLREHGSAWALALPGLERDLHQIAGRLVDESGPVAELRWWVAETTRRVKALREKIERLTPWLSPQNRDLFNLISDEVPKGLSELSLGSLWAAAADIDVRLGKILDDSATDPVLRLTARNLREQLPASLAEADQLVKKLTKLADQADQLIQTTDFRFLFDHSRKLLSIGYDVTRQLRMAGCYDLLASEARSAIFAAIAKGDIPQESWFHLGRAQVLWQGEGVLLSWSGTMFEYLMPTLWFRHYPRSILEQSARVAVQCQEDWATEKEMPWGVSEAAYNIQDSAGNYQYRAFGIPALAINPSTDDDIVVSPYATFLALTVDPRSAVRNLQRMAELGWMGELGFYDAVDFGPARLGPEERFKVVRCWMSHHQGMSLLAVCNLLTDGAIQKLFHSEPAICATELLLHEKLMPVSNSIERARPAKAGVREQGIGNRE
jgi:hypothetical protein